MGKDSRMQVAGRGSFIEILEARTLLSNGNTFAQGTYSAVARDAASGKMYVAYYDQTQRDLRFAVRSSDTGSWESPTNDVIDDGGTTDPALRQVGFYVSMDLDSTGKPGVAYFDGWAGRLKYAHYNGTSWDVQYAGTAGRSGNYPSLKYYQDKPTISHFVRTSSDGSTGYLRVEQGNGATPTSWSNATVDNTFNAGRYSSLALNTSTGKWGIAYDDGAVGTIGGKYIESTGTSITQWGTRAAIPLPSGFDPSEAVWNSLVYTGSVQPAVAWYYPLTAAVFFSQRSTTGTWSTKSIDGNGTVGKYPNLTYDGSLFHVYYQDSTDRIEGQKGSGVSSTWAPDTTLAAQKGAEIKVFRGSNGVNYFAYELAPDATHSTLYVNDDRTGTSWVKESGTTAFGGTSEHTSVVFDANDTNHPGDAMYVIGGATAGNGRSNKVSASNDGLNWWTVRANNDTAHTGFTGRMSHASVRFDNKLWVIGGQTGSTAATVVGDVWWSSNGADWTQALDQNGNPVNIGPRRDAAIATFGSTMFVFGGTDTAGSDTGNYVYTSDGVTWYTVTAGMAQRHGATAMEYNGALYLVGGQGADTSTWKSTDGLSWNQQPANVTFYTTAGAGAVFDGKMWMIDSSRAQWSTDGFNWNDTANPGIGGVFDQRYGQTVLAFAKPGGSTRIWVLGGQSGSGSGAIFRDDAWSSD